MKKGIHPESYRLVAFKDMSNEHVFITRSCVNTRETIDIEGVTYPLVKVEISNTSHPFYTGKMKLVDTAGRVDKFYQRYKSVTRAVRSNTLHQDTSEPHSITDWVRLFHARCLHPWGKCREFLRKRFTFPRGRMGYRLYRPLSPHSSFPPPGKVPGIPAILVHFPPCGVLMKIQQSKRPGPPTALRRAPPSRAEGG